MVRRLAREHGLPLEEVREARQATTRAFREAGLVVGSGSRALSEDALAEVLAKLAGVPTVPRGTLSSAWQGLTDAAKGDTDPERQLLPLEPALDAFVEWYLVNMFTASDQSASSDKKFDAAVRISREHSLPLTEVQTIIHAFTEARGGAALSKDTFSSVLAKVAGVTKISPDMFSSAWRAMNRAEKCRRAPEGLLIPWESALDAFVEWYVPNIFQREKSASIDTDTHEIANESGIPVFLVEKVRRRFEHFDVDGNHRLDYPEFKEMCAQLMNAKEKGDIAEPRLKRWFKEADTDGSGAVSFNEFVVWYVKYFNPDSEGKNALDVGPIGLFYGSYDPQLQRRNNRRVENEFAHDARRTKTISRCEQFSAREMQALSSW